MASATTDPRHRLIRSRPHWPREERREEGLRGVGGPVRRRPVSSLQGADTDLLLQYEPYTG